MGMRVSRLPSPAAGALALAVAVLALVSAACSNGGGHSAATPTARSRGRVAPCKLDRAQKRAVARALADIRRLRRIQAPMHTFSERGAPTQNAVTGKLMLDLGSTHLPPDVFAHLLHLGKTAVSLCGDCTKGLEGDEPFLNNREEKRC
jgi:hypothetical protein